MATVKPSDIVEIFNKNIKIPINSTIAWAYDSLPPTGSAGSAARADYRSWFPGYKAGITQDVDISGISGDVTPSIVRQRVVELAAKFTLLRKVNLYIRYRSGSSTYSTIVNDTKVAHLDSSYLTEVLDNDNIDIESGEDLDYSKLEAYMVQIADKVREKQNQSISISKTYCHSDCHIDCHGYCNCYTAPPPACVNPSKVYAFGACVCYYTPKCTVTFTTGKVYTNLNLVISKSDIVDNTVKGTVGKKVWDWYNTYTKRPPEVSGLWYWIDDILNSGNSESVVLQSFLYQAFVHGERSSSTASGVGYGQRVWTYCEWLNR